MSDNGTPQGAWIRQALADYERRLVGYALRLTGDLETARDVVQDTFLKLCTADHAAIDGHLGPWLYTVCRNRALDVLKKEGRMESLQDSVMHSLPARGLSPGAAAEANETQHMIRTVVTTLPKRQQEVFMLKFHDGLTYREISDVVGMPLATVSHTIHTALNTIREQLRAQHASAPDA
ncbi:MAG: DNA-directed RNA polymerase sigma-70 factor [Candidatus Hydrogenedentota bacterium]